MDGKITSKDIICIAICFVTIFLFIGALWIGQIKQEKHMDEVEAEHLQTKANYEELMERYQNLLEDYQALEEQIGSNTCEETTDEEVEYTIPLVANINPVETQNEEQTEEVIVTTPITPQPTVSTPTYSYSYGQHLNYVAIGNSITIHGENEYWWNNIGMGATTIDKDFVHQVLAGLQALTGSASVSVYNYYPWEIQVNDRAETYSLIDHLLDTQPDIITLQMSENIIDMSHYESDWEELIRYVQNKCPNAQIFVIDDFWYGGDKSTLKKQAAQNCGVQFIDLSGIRGKSEYQCGMGTTVYDAEGNPHTVNHEGVAAHPGDAGMAYIANQILQYIH